MATDFFTKTVWTLKGPVTYYLLFFIHLHSRRVHLAGMTPHPNGEWMAQVARNMSQVFADEPEESRPTHIIRDRDTKFTAQFCSILESDGIEFRPIPPLSPNLNPFAESWVLRVKRECLDHFVVFGRETPTHDYVAVARILSSAQTPSRAWQRAHQWRIAAGGISRLDSAQRRSSATSRSGDC